MARASRLSRPFLPVAAAVVALLGCKPAMEFPTCADGGEEIAFDQAPTWSADVAPVVFEHCVQCHRRDGSAPMAFTTHEEAAPWAELMAAATTERRMPPAGPTSCGECQTFKDSHWLSPQELAVFRAWAASGAPEGDPSAVPELPPVPGGLDRVDLSLQMPEQYLPAGANGADDYRCFIVTPDLAETQYLTGFAVDPGQDALVHHVILYGLYTSEHRSLAAELAGQDDKAGFGCFGDSGIDEAPMLAGWAPGTPPILYPEDTGVRLLPGMELVLQVHYHTEINSLPDQSTMHLRLEDSVPQEAVILPVGDWEFSVAPGQELGATYQQDGDFIGPVGPVQVHGVAPHMHTRGRTLQVELWELDDYQCMVDIPHWDFDDQGLYFYEEPVTVKGGANMRITCGFDTRGADGPVEWGDGTEDEMCLALFYVTGIPQNILDEQYASLE